MLLDPIKLVKIYQKTYRILGFKGISLTKDGDSMGFKRMSSDVHRGFIVFHHEKMVISSDLKSKHGDFGWFNQQGQTC